MKKKALEKTYRDLYANIRALAICLFVMCVLCIVHSFVDFIDWDILFFSLLFGFIGGCIICIYNIIQYSRILNNIMHTDFPTDKCYDVQIRTNTPHDIYIKNHAENLCIWYVEDEDSIKYQYTLDGKTYEYSISISLAKTFLDCKFFKYL